MEERHRRVFIAVLREYESALENLAQKRVDFATAKMSWAATERFEGYTNGENTITYDERTAGDVIERYERDIRYLTREVEEWRLALTETLNA